MSMLSKRLARFGPLMGCAMPLCRTNRVVPCPWACGPTWFKKLNSLCRNKSMNTIALLSYVAIRIFYVFF